ARRVVGRALLVKAKILASQRSFFEAMALLATIRKEHGEDKKLSAQTAFYAALITPATSDVDNAVAAFRAVVQEFPEDRNTVRLASEAAVTMLRTKKDYLESLVALRTEA